MNMQVSAGVPGKIRIELDGQVLELDQSLGLLDALHAMKAWMSKGFYPAEPKAFMGTAQAEEFLPPVLEVPAAEETAPALEETPMPKKRVKP